GGGAAGAAGRERRRVRGERRRGGRRRTEAGDEGERRNEAGHEANDSGLRESQEWGSPLEGHRGSRCGPQSDTGDVPTPDFRRGPPARARRTPARTGSADLVYDFPRWPAVRYDCRGVPRAAALAEMGL